MADVAAVAPAGAAGLPRPTYPFTVRSADIFRIALPASVAFITEPLVGLVDITVIGRLGDAALLGGLVLGALVFDVIFALAYFLRVGTAGLTAQAVGARDPHDGLMHVSRAILVAVAIGLLLIALTQPLLWVSGLILAPTPEVSRALGVYLGVRMLAAPFSLINYALLGWFYGRANARTGMSLQILIHGINIVLNVAFVFGLGWGVAGAAFATVCGNVAAALVGLLLMVRHFGGLRRLLGLIVPAQLLDAAALRRMFSLSRDITIRSAALMASYAYFAAQGSRAGEVVLSGNAILMNMLMIMAFFLDGLAQAAEQLTGKAVGANWPPAFDGAVRLSTAWGVVIGLGLSGLVLFGGGALIDLMTTSEPVRQHALAYLPLAALTGITGVPAFVMDGVVSGATLNTVMRNGMLLALALFLGAALTLQPLLGNSGLWIALNGFFVARGGILWFGMERRKAGLFAA
ncbi:MAG: MATE family efflux transporter [Devosia sp.]|nr:MATE family efflux transporter [Devosia sp.]